MELFLLGMLLALILAFIVYILTRRKTEPPLAEEIGALKQALEETVRQGRHLQDTITGIYASSGRRGALGEASLNALLEDAFPQERLGRVRFKDGTIVDASVRIGSKIIPIDAKFPLNHYREMRDAHGAEQERARKALMRAARDRIREASHYARPDEGTIEYVLLFIPSIALRDEIISDEHVRQEAYACKVVVTCPADILYYLELVSHSIRVDEATRNAERIVDQLSAAQKLLADAEGASATMRKHLTNALQKQADVEESHRKLRGLLERQ